MGDVSVSLPLAGGMSSGTEERMIRIACDSERDAEEAGDGGADLPKLSPLSKAGICLREPAGAAAERAGAGA